MMSSESSSAKVKSTLFLICSRVRALDSRIWRATYRSLMMMEIVPVTTSTKIGISVMAR